MPHVILNTNQTIEQIFARFEPYAVQEAANRYKVEEAYLSHTRSTVLLRCITIERGFNKTFFLRLVQKDNSITVGLDLLNPPDKSDGVKRLIAIVAQRILLSAPGSSIASTNIQPFLREVT